MMKCPFCQFDNEDGALFCEQCKSDLTAAPAGVPADAPAAMAVEASPVAAAAPAGAPAAPPAGEEVAAEKLAAGAVPKLVVLRGLKLQVEYPLYEGTNFVGRADEKPVDIDLDDQEPPDRVWSSRQHACITYANSELHIEDLNSANGTFVNRVRIYPGQKRGLRSGDVIQVGTVQMKLKTS